MTEPKSVALIREALEAYSSDADSERQLPGNSTAQERIMYAVARHQFFSGVCTPSAIAEVPQHVAALSAQVREIRQAGAQLSNCAFNLAQRNPGQFTTRDIEALDTARKAWDAAMSAAARGEKSV